MFNNFINIHDIHDLFKKSGKVSSGIASRLNINRQKRVIEAWKHTSSPPTNWWDIPRPSKLFEKIGHVTGHPTGHGDLFRPWCWQLNAGDQYQLFMRILFTPPLRWRVTVP